MSYPNFRATVGTGREKQDRRETVRVFTQLVDQNRWCGVEYDAATNAVIATASRGTQRETRKALAQARAHAT